jgi:hypothetical protein
LGWGVDEQWEVVHNQKKKKERKKFDQNGRRENERKRDAVMPVGDGSCWCVLRLFSLFMTVWC